MKKISGLTKAIQVQLIKADNNVVVNCDFSKWSDKVGAGTVGMILFAPLVATAAFGTVKQSRLPNEVFAEIEKFILYGGNSAVVSMGGRLKEDEIECPICKAKNPKGQKYCRECGGKLENNCPSCGASIDTDTKFCPECGSLTAISIRCVNCGVALKEGQKFCHSCGARQEKTCSQCGAVINLDAKFCHVCGTSTSDKKLCPNCKAEIASDAAFCKGCGAKISVN